MTQTIPDVDKVADDLGAAFDEKNRSLFRARYNIAPTQQHWLAREVEGRRELVPAAWGLPPRWKIPMQIQLRSEKVPKGLFRKNFAERRCVIPADGFYEWVGSEKDRKPIWFHRPRGGLVFIAGLYDPPREDTKHPTLPSFAVLTTVPNKLVAGTHDRMPVILPAELVGEWLGRGGESLLAPAPDDYLVATPVSTRVNSTRNDDPGVLEEAAT